MSKKQQSQGGATVVETESTAGVYADAEEARAAAAEADPNSPPRKKALRNAVTILAESIPDVPAWQHAAAAALHGWAEHAHHEGAQLEIELDDYLAALKAASAPNAKGEYVPHARALSRHAAISNRS
jgi:hypothetical protein